MKSQAREWGYGAMRLMKKKKNKAEGLGGSGAESKERGEKDEKGGGNMVGSRALRVTGLLSFLIFVFLYFIFLGLFLLLLLGSGLNKLGPVFQFSAFIFFASFSQIIQYLQNKMKSNKNLTIVIIPSIN